jgi:sec-independent protein translocase protein TatC
MIKNPEQSVEEVEEAAAGGELSLLGHLNELRIRLTWAVGGLLVATVISFVFAEQLLNFLLRPYGGQLQMLRPTEGIETFFKVSLLSGAILAMPIILYQIWLFIAPGLTRQERRYVYLFIPSALSLFVIGLSFAWFILLPAAVHFLAGFMPDIFMTEWTGQDYISFVVRMLFWIGVSFEMPVIVYLIARVGILTADTLREQWRVAVVIIAVLAAIITPSVDPITMLLTMLPLNILYGLSIVLARVGQRQFEKSMAV